MQFDDVIVGGTTLVIPAIQSPDFIAGSTGWSVNIDGSAEFNNVTVRGQVHTGTATDYVEINAAPQPEIDFSTSHPDQIEPASIGFGVFGGNAWFLQGPDLGQGADFIAFEASAALNILSMEYNGLFEIANPGLEARIRMGSMWVALTGDDYINLDTPSFRTNNLDRGRGLMNYTPSTVSTALAAAEQIHVTSDVVTFEPGRAYRITYHYEGSGNTANDVIGFRLRRTSLAGTGLFDTLRTHTLNAVNAIVNGESAQYVSNQTGANLTTVIVGTVYRVAGVGTVQGFANAANPAWIKIEDVGEASDYPNIKAL